jgi:hypothetical protein
MSTKKILPYALAAALALTLTSCGDKADATGTGDTLSNEEIDSMVLALDEIGSLSFLGGRGTSAAGLAAQAQSGSFPVDQSESCPGGGNTHLTGTVSYSVSGQTETLTANLTQTLSNCKGNVFNGHQFTFNGNPNVAWSLNASVNSSTEAGTVTVHRAGNIAWSGSGGKSGNCSIDINVSATVDAAGNATGTVTGHLCNRSISATL